jgi:NAD(P)-dependent dehydrogenase (short-subunit alcohol dehydrogenase family)
MPVVAIIGIGSDIGRELALRYAAQNWTVWGTFRTRAGLEGMPPGIRLTPCELTARESIAAAVDKFCREGLSWDVLVVAAGTEEPIGPFWECDEDAWERGVQVNALSPLRLVRQLYPLRNKSGAPSVAFFSGSGTNNAAPAYSSYCVSKILLIKMCELLDAESSDTSFFIIGPGIVRTKIHDQTLRASGRSGDNYRKVVEFLGSANPGTSHDDIYACLQWCVNAGKAVVGGRNLSLVHDAWRGGGVALARRLEQDENIYKLRRFGNDMRISGGNA